MTTSSEDLHVLFFPLMAQGHMIPTLDIARLFAARGVTVTIVTTPLNAPFFSKTPRSPRIALRTVEFPAKEAGLPEGFENLDMVTEPDQHRKFFNALSFLRQPVDEILCELRPHALVADLFFTWAPDLASEHAIPGILFHGTSFISMCCMHSLVAHKPHELVGSDIERFTLPGLPDEIELTRMQIPDIFRHGIVNDLSRMLDRTQEAAARSYGMIVNSFQELEPAYAKHYRNVMQKKAWHIGPVSLYNKGNAEKSQRGKEASISEHECLQWLDSKAPSSVVYMCFGTMASFPASQLREIAIGLEASGQDFIWVVRNPSSEEEYLPDGFEERIEGKGLIIRGWAPQVLILDHKALGCFVTHCGWNSVLEGVSAGIPMVTWPIFADQFYNEKLVTEIVGIGVGVGAAKWERLVGDFVQSSQLERALKKVMEGERSGEMRARAKALGEVARGTVEEGGSSYMDLGNLIEDLRSHMIQVQRNVT